MLEMTCRGLCYSVSFFQTPHPDHYFINVGEFRKDQKADLCDINVNAAAMELYIWQGCN